MKFLLIVIVLLATGCANSTKPSKSVAQKPAVNPSTIEETARVRVLDCFFRWEMSLYAYVNRSAGYNKDQVVKKLEERYGSEGNLRPEIEPATDFVYSLKTVGKNPISALGSDLVEGFKSCLSEKQLSENERFLSRCVGLGRYILFVATAKDAGRTKQQVLAELAPAGELTINIIDQAYASPTYNHGEQVLSVWQECSNMVERGETGTYTLRRNLRFRTGGNW